MNKISNTKKIWKILSFLLMWSYLVVLIIPFGHGLSAHEHGPNHGQEQEADPCHIRIFHEDITHACDHETHVTHVLEDCEFCDTLTNSQYFLPIISKIDDPVSDIESRRLRVQEEKFTTYRTSVFLRGPPVS